MTKLIPPPFNEHLAEFAREFLKRERARREHLQERMRTLRPEIPVQVPLDPEWLQQRAEFATRWQELTDEGIAAGYLEEEDYDSLGSSGLVVTTNTTRTEWRPNPEYIPPTQQELAAADAGGRPGYITIPVVRGGRIEG